MLKDFLSGYVSLFKSILLILALLAAGSLICYAFVWPLWYTATVNASLYTILSLIFFGILIIWSIVSKIRDRLQKYPNTQEKKRYLTNLGIMLLFWIAMIAAAAAGFTFVLQGKRLLGLVFLVLIFILFGLFSSFKKKHIHATA